MAGLSHKLTSLVKAAPQLVPYTLTSLGAGAPPPTPGGDRGFAGRVDSLRQQIAKECGPLFLISMQDQARQRQRERLEDALLEAGEKLLAANLFQQSSLQLFVNRLSAEKPETLQRQVKDNNPLVRWLVTSAIGRRHLHLEADLIQCLDDLHPAVRAEAHKALVRVARGSDFGPVHGASQKGIARAVEKWQHWLALQNGESPDMPTKGDSVAATPASDKVDPVKAVHLVLDHGNRELQTVPSEVTRLCDELVKAKGDEQMSVLARLRDAKGIDNTDALALAIPKLSVGAAQREARDALAQRLTRMTAATLRDKMQDDDVEVRRAAALACGRKQATEHIPDLLQLLDDPEVAVIQAARTALKELTGEDFGPDEESGRRGRASAAAAWRKWWKEHADSRK
jgi:HEAT repeat protein